MTLGRAVLALSAAIGPGFAAPAEPAEAHEEPKPEPKGGVVVDEDGSTWVLEPLDEESVRDAIARQEAVPMPALSTIVDDVYEQPTWLQREQLAQLEASPRVKAPHSLSK